MNGCPSPAQDWVKGVADWTQDRRNSGPFNPHECPRDSLVQGLTGSCFFKPLPALSGLEGRGAPALALTQLCSWPPPRPQGLLGPKPELKLQTQQHSSSFVPGRGRGVGVGTAG